MSGRPIDFLSADAARFNQLRDEWRSAAASRALPKAALRVASVLPTFVNREYGYAFPTDEDLATAINADQRTVKRGLVSLEEAELIERKTTVKRDAKDEAFGKLRRIFLTLPQVKGQEVKGQSEVKGQKQLGEGTPVCPYILDSTPDKVSRQMENVTVSVSTRERKVVPSPPPKIVPSVPARENVPSPYRDGDEFLDTFDRFVMTMTDGKTLKRVAAYRIRDSVEV